MTLFATSKSRKAPQRRKPKRTDVTSLVALETQLNREWEADQSAVAVYMQTCGRIALHWVAGDPYNVVFPDWYRGERLAKACQWLKGLNGADKGKITAARAAMIRELLAIWPTYSQRCTGYHYGDGERPPELLPTTWDGLVGMAGTVGMEASKAELKEIAPDLPKFRCRESEDFHLAALCIIFLNRSLKRKLCDLND